MTPSPAPGLVDTWFTLPFVIGVACVFALVALTVWVLTPREDEQDEAPAYDDCPAHHYVAVNGDWLCTLCGDIVRSPLNCGGLHRYVKRGQSLTCTVCGHRTERPYDRESGVA